MIRQYIERTFIDFKYVSVDAGFSIYPYKALSKGLMLKVTSQLLRKLIRMIFIEKFKRTVNNLKLSRLMQKSIGYGRRYLDITG